MSERIVEIMKLLAPSLGTILSPIASRLASRFLNRLLPAGTILLNKWGTCIVVGIGGGLGAVLVYWTYTGSINYWWGIIGFFGAAIICLIYMHYFAYPFKKFRVTCLEDDNRNVLEGTKKGRGLIANGSHGAYDSDRKRWRFRSGGIWGPYISVPLQEGRYRATFRIELSGLDWGQDERLFRIDVCASYRGLRGNEDRRAEKTLALRLITTKDFNGTDRYKKFYLDFCVYHHEDYVEFRVWPEGSQRTITFDYVKLSHLRLF